MTTLIRFEPPAKTLNQNDRMHWAKKAELTRLWREAAYVAACRLGPLQDRSHGPCEVRFYFPVRDSRRRDGMNVSPTCKAAIDGLVDAGVWPDDNTDWVDLRDSRYTRMTTDVVIELVEVDATAPEPVWPNGDERELGMARIRDLRDQLKGDAS